MTKIEIKPLLKAGVHFGHLTRKWNPNMAPFIHMEKNGIHIINLYNTASKIEEAASALSKIASSGRKILFVNQLLVQNILQTSIERYRKNNLFHQRCLKLLLRVVNYELSELS